MRKIKVRIWVSLLVLATSLLASLLTVVIGGMVESRGRKDVALVLGNKVHESGLPSARLIARLDHAALLYEKGLCDLIIVSGALGVEGHDEALVMRDYLLVKGVVESDVIADSDGWNTWDSALNARKITLEKGMDNPSIVAVSQYHHLLRCRLALRQAGFDDVTSSYARYYEWRDLYSILREVPACVKYLFLEVGND